MITEKEMLFKIIGKDKKRGWLGHKYLLALQFVDKRFERSYFGQTKTLPVAFDIYCSVEVGEKYLFTMYSVDNLNWKFSKVGLERKE